MISDKIQQVAEELRNQISESMLSEIAEYLYHDEWGVAWYALWAAIYESKQSIPQSLRDELVDIGKELGEDFENIQKQMPLTTIG